MSDTAAELSVDSNPVAVTLESVVADLQLRVQTLETKVAALPDSRQIEEHVTQRVKASLPPAPPPVDPTHAPSFKDISLPFPNVETIVATAQTTWSLFSMFDELKSLFWMLVDRRYHMAWATRIFTVILLVAILASQYWLPLAFDNLIGRTWEKAIDLLLGFVMFMMLHFEMRRYQQWRGRR